MKFCYRIIVVVGWMLSISLTSLAVTKRCEKKSTVVLQAAFKQAKNTDSDYPAKNHYGLVNCSGSIIWNFNKEEIVMLQDFACRPPYTFYASPFICNIIKKPLYSPPRSVLNILNSSYFFI